LNGFDFRVVKPSGEENGFLIDSLYNEMYMTVKKKTNPEPSEPIATPIFFIQSFRTTVFFFNSLSAVYRKIISASYM
jgi:hypothetical protein